MMIWARCVGAALMLLAIGSSVAAARDWDTVRIGTEGSYPPFNYVGPDKALKGFDVDIARALCREMQVTCTFVVQDWEGLIPGLLAHKFDAIVASMSITDERRKVVAFTDKYYLAPARFVVRKDAGISDVDPRAMEGRTIGAQASTIQASYLEEEYGGSDIRLYQTEEEATRDLKAGRLDAVFGNSVVLYGWLSKEGADCCAFTGPSYSDPEHFGLGAGIALRKEDGDLKAKFDKALDAILADGTYKKINDKYFPFSIY